MAKKNDRRAQSDDVELQARALKAMRRYLDSGDLTGDDFSDEVARRLGRDLA